MNVSAVGGRDILAIHYIVLHGDPTFTTFYTEGGWRNATMKAGESRTIDLTAEYDLRTVSWSRFSLVYDVEDADPVQHSRCMVSRQSFESIIVPAQSPASTRPP
jgi:hypothetical protein